MVSTKYHNELSTHNAPIVKAASKFFPLSESTREVGSLFALDQVMSATTPAPPYRKNPTKFQTWNSNLLSV